MSAEDSVGTLVAAIEPVDEVAINDALRFGMLLHRHLRQRGDAVIRGHQQRVLVAANRGVEVFDHLRDQPVRAERHVHHFVRIGAVGVADDIVRRETQAEHVGGAVGAELFGGQRLFGEVPEQFGAITTETQRSTENGFLWISLCSSVSLW